MKIAWLREKVYKWSKRWKKRNDVKKTAFLLHHDTARTPRSGARNVGHSRGWNVFFIPPHSRDLESRDYHVLLFILTDVTWRHVTVTSSLFLFTDVTWSLWPGVKRLSRLSYPSSTSFVHLNILCLAPGSLPMTRLRKRCWPGFRSSRKTSIFRRFKKLVNREVHRPAGVMI